jgi:hypothetical protein
VGHPFKRLLSRGEIPSVTNEKFDPRTEMKFVTIAEL